MEHFDARRQVGFLNHDCVAIRRRMQGQRIAATRGSNRLRIDRGGAVLAHQPIWPLEESNRPADLASVENRNYVSVRLFIKQKAYLCSIFACCISMQVAIGNLRQRNAD